jgi:hypothetical protein
MARRQHRALRAARLVVAQHPRQQRLADAATAMRGHNVHVRAPRRAHRIDAANAAHDRVSVERHVLAKRSIVAEQVVGDRSPARDLTQALRVLLGVKLSLLFPIDCQNGDQ